MSYSSTSPELGYIFYPAAHPADPGHPRLDIFLRKTPTGRHFDVAMAHLAIFTNQNLIEPMSVSLHHLGPFAGRVSPGRIIMESFQKKTVEAFTFGGQFEVESQPDLTSLTIRSQTPILEIVQAETVSSRLALEVEVLLASRRAAWVQDPDGLARRLAGLDEVTLYQLCLDELHKKFSLLPHQLDSFNTAFNKLLNDERRDFQSKYNREPQAQLLEQLL